MDAVMISLRPEWCEKAEDGSKPVEVRKSKPKLPTPFKVYIYCTIGPHFWRVRKPNDAFYPKGWPCPGNGSVIGEFTCDWIKPYMMTPGALRHLSRISCVPVAELVEYGRGRNILHGWHISDLVIYSKPRLLSDFGLTRPPQSWCYVETTEAVSA